MTTHRPVAASAALSVLVGALAVALVATAPGQRLALAVTVGGLVPLAVGLELRKRGSAFGVVLVLIGTAGAAGGLALAVIRGGSYSNTIEVLPGLLGLSVLVLGLGPVRDGWERLLVSLGTGLILLTVVASAAVYGSDTMGILAAGIGAVVAWDLGEQAVNLGEQVGREAKPRGVVLVHVGATAAVAGAAVLVVRAIQGVGITGVPLIALGGLLGAGLTLTLALYN